MPDRVYLDWNATTPLRREAREAMAAAWDLAGNPSSVHAEGRQARKLVEEREDRGRRRRRRAGSETSCLHQAEPRRMRWR